ncbi:MAG: cyclic nucleotide-binding domain-containing protein [Magnetococcales bacterium]|nr:cyclic nucleotide-binding domain-containing protein [Magnetococcales bacterium]
MLKEQTKNRATQEECWLLEKGYLTGLSPERCKEFLGQLNTVHVKAGETIFAQGELEEQLFIIRSGEVAVGHTSDNHNRVEFGMFGSVDFYEDDTTDAQWLDKAIMKSGECIGELDVGRQVRHNLTARAENNAELFCLDAACLKAMAGKNEKLCQTLGNALRRSIKKVNNRAMSR